MTLITVFPYPDGTIISADSQETVKDLHGNEFKYSVLKLRPEKIGNFQVVIAGGGNGDAIEAFIEDCKQSFADSPLDNLDAFKKAFQSKLQKCRKELRSNGDGNKMHLLIAAHVGTSYSVWKTTSHVFRDVTEPDMIGFTDYMYRHTAKEFHPASLPATQLILLSLRVLDFARQTSTCIDEPYSVIVARRDGIHVFDPELIKQFVQSISVFGAAVNGLLLACGDTSIRSEVFKEKIKEFTDTALHLRQEYVQQAGERTFKRMFEPGFSGDPVSVTPPRTKFTVGYDDSGMRVDVSEESDEEYQQRLAMMREAESMKEEMRIAQEKLAKLIQGREPLYQGKERVLLGPTRPMKALSN